LEKKYYMRGKEIKVLKERRRDESTIKVTEPVYESNIRDHKTGYILHTCVCIIRKKTQNS
jgi:hypothetical protein